MMLCTLYAHGLTLIGSVDYCTPAAWYNNLLLGNIPAAVSAVLAAAVVAAAGHDVVVAVAVVVVEVTCRTPFGTMQQLPLPRPSIVQTAIETKMIVKRKKMMTDGGYVDVADAGCGGSHCS